MTPFLLRLVACGLVMTAMDWSCWAQKPLIPSGVAAGDIDTHSAVVWSRCDRPARMHVAYACDGMPWARATGADALADTDFAAKVLLEDLLPGKEYSYRVTFQSLEDVREHSDPAEGRFRTAPVERQRIRFVWSGDTAGQGWGINERQGGMKIYETMRKFRPDFFIHSGDTIYADGPILPEVRLDDGSIWSNVTIPEKTKVAESISEFHANYRYNLLDENVRNFNAEVAMFAQWDDHETTNNWFPNERLEADDRYTVKSVALLAARARKAFFDYLPIRARSNRDIHRSFRYGPDLEVFLIDMRSFRGDNSANDQSEPGAASAILGQRQSDWLASGLQRSTATWKVVASDMPLGLIIRDGSSFEGIANGDGAPRGRELELAALLSRIKQANVRNVVWITADVHYAAAHRYAPQHAVFKDFHPFWEFVSGPLHAGTFGPNPLDNTFGPQLEFLGIPADLKPNRPPSDGYQFFGGMELDPDDQSLTVSQHNAAGQRIYSVKLQPE